MKRLASIILFSLFGFGKVVFAQDMHLDAFPLSSVRLSSGPFQDAQQVDLKYILELSPDRLLAPFRKESAINTAAKNYPNWENTGLDGHIGGHYLTSLAQMVAATGNKEVKRRLDYMVSVLDSCQRANGDGYVGGIPGGKAMWQEIARGKIDAGTFSLNQKWVPLYNIHKLFAGLRDAYIIAQNQQAKEILVKLTDWFIGVTSNLSDAQMRDMLRSEHGGLNEVFADVAVMTGNKKYLELAIRCSDKSTLTPLLINEDKLNGLHANMQIPKVIGYQRVGHEEKDAAWTKAADFFWQTVTDHRTVSIGGNSVREHFHPANNFSSMINSVEGPETCNSYNMLKLTRLLFLDNPSSRYIDYYERTLYNHILSTQHPESGGFVYFTPMRPQHYRVYSKSQQGFWCCVGSGMENHGKYGELIYAHHENDLYINLFIPSVLNWKEKGIVVTQKTGFPFEEKTELELKVTKSSKFGVHIRYPDWTSDMRVLVNNQVVKIERGKDSYITINRLWKSGDKVEVILPMSTKMEILPDSSSWVSFVHGPIVLAAVTDHQNLTGLFADSSRMGHIASGPLYPLAKAPILVSNEQDFAKYLHPVAGHAMTYSFEDIINQKQFQNLQLKPFFQIHDSRYVIYFPYTKPSELESKLKELAKNDDLTLALEKETVDKVAPGEQQPESDHNFKGENTEIGVFEDVHYRKATGWFSYDLRNSAKAAKTLRVTYNTSANQDFEVYLNDILLKRVNLPGKKEAAFFDENYIIPDALRTFDILTVKFKALPGSVVGNVYDVRLIK